MAVEAVAHISVVRNIFNDTEFGAELLHLQAGQRFGRCAVNGIQIAVFLLKFVDFGIDMFQHFQRIFYYTAAVIHLMR